MVSRHFDADLLFLTLQGAAEYPSAYPQLTELITGTRKTDPDFVRRYEAHLRKLASAPRATAVEAVTRLRAGRRFALLGRVLLVDDDDRPILRVDRRARVQPLLGIALQLLLGNRHRLVQPPAWAGAGRRARPPRPAQGAAW